jgi:hypothetical protein
VYSQFDFETAELSGAAMSIILTTVKVIPKKLRGFGPIANYADQATAACWRSSDNFGG